MKHKFKNIYFATKCFFLSFTALLILLLIIFVAIENSYIEKKANDIMASEKMFVTLIGEKFSSSLKAGVNDLKYLSDTFNFDREKTQLKWETVIKSSGAYKRIRLVDSSGDEIFAVDIDGSDAVSSNIFDETYFSQVDSLESGQIYISEVVRKQVVDDDEELLAMFCTPIEIDGKKNFIILESDVGILFEKITEQMTGTSGEVFLLNNSGYWSSTLASYSEVDSNYYQLSYSVGILPTEEWEGLKEYNHTIEDIGLYSFIELDYKSILPDDLKDSIVVQENGCIILTLVRSKGEYHYYFNSEITAKIARVFEKKYMYFIGCVIISITIVIFLLANRNNLEKMRNFSHYDPLTKVYNRRQGFELLQNQITNIKRYKRICLCFIDINGLKEVNDTLGHAYGDELILTVTDTVKHTIRQDDMIIRMGGDEFLIVLAKVGKSTAETIWTRITESFKNVNAMDNRKYIISVSHGIVEVCHEQEDIDLNALITDADDKMYKEKTRIKKSVKIIRKNI